MSRKTVKVQKSGDQVNDEHEMLQQDDFRWLNEFRDLLSPYWSSRVEYRSENKEPILVLRGTEPSKR